MLTSSPWSCFRLQVACFSSDAKNWWDEARLLGTVLRTDPARKKYLKDLDIRVDAWGEKGAFIDNVTVSVRLEGVDGARLVRARTKIEGEEIEKMKVDDGE